MPPSDQPEKQSSKKPAPDNDFIPLAEPDTAQRPRPKAPRPAPAQGAGAAAGASRPVLKPAVQPAAKQAAAARHVSSAVEVVEDSGEGGVPWFHQHVVWGVVAGAGAIALAGVLLGSLPIKVAAVVLALTILQGLWRGCAEIVGFVVGMAVAALVAPALGRAFEGVVASVLGTAGIVNRVMSVVLVALVITAVIGVAGSVVAKRHLKKRPGLRAYDKYAGAGLGLVEGCLVALLVLWVPAALRPVAEIAMANDREMEEWAARGGEPAARTAPSWAGELLEFADSTKSSFVGGLVESTNPLPDSRLLSLASDFSAISRDEEAMGELLQSEPIQRMENLPSVQHAIETIKGDPELSGLVGEGGVTPEAIMAFFSSDTMLKVLDGTTIVEDSAPLVTDLERVIREVKQRMDQRKGGGG